jgi:hypothetical protein
LRVAIRAVLADRAALPEILELPVPRTNVHRLRPNQTIGTPLLETVRDPSRHAADGEGRREERHVQIESVQQERRVELDICLKVTSRLALFE